MKESFKKCAQCAGSGVAGGVMGHLGCIAAPVGMAMLGMAGGAASIAIGAAFTVAGLGAWYGLRGRFAGSTERKIVIGSAVAGFALMSAFNLCGSGGDEHAYMHMHHHDAVQEMSDNARVLHMSVAEYMRSICTTPAGP